MTRTQTIKVRPTWMPSLKRVLPAGTIILLSFLALMQHCELAKVQSERDTAVNSALEYKNAYNGEHRKRFALFMQQQHGKAQSGVTQGHYDALKMYSHKAALSQERRLQVSHAQMVHSFKVAE